MAVAVADGGGVVAVAGGAAVVGVGVEVGGSGVAVGGAGGGVAVDGTAVDVGGTGVVVGGREVAVGGAVDAVGSALATASAGAVVGTAPSWPRATTVTTLFIDPGWTRQKYWNVPSSVKVNENVSPLARRTESQIPDPVPLLPEVLVCCTPS